MWCTGALLAYGVCPIWAEWIGVAELLVVLQLLPPPPGAAGSMPLHMMTAARSAPIRAGSALRSCPAYAPLPSPPPHAPVKIYVVVVDEATGQLVQQGLDELAILVSPGWPPATALLRLWHPCAALPWVDVFAGQPALPTLLWLQICMPQHWWRPCRCRSAAVGGVASATAAPNRCMSTLVPCLGCPAADLHHRRPQVRC